MDAIEVVKSKFVSDIDKICRKHGITLCIKREFVNDDMIYFQDAFCNEIINIGELEREIRR
jgi:hypothetical protein